MRILLFLLLLCSQTTSFAQSVNNYPSPTEAHQLVPGTNIYLIPPTNFSVSENFTGFQNPEDPTSMIMVVSMPGPFDQVSAGFTEEMLASRGMVLLDKQPATVGGKDAFYVELDQNSQGLTFTKSILIYGDSTETTIINGISVKDSVALGISIRESVRSAVIDRGVRAKPRTELTFTVDEAAGNLQFISVIGNGVLLNRDGKTPTESTDKANLIIDRSRNNNEIKDKKAFTLLRLFSLPGGYELASKKYPRKIKLAGMEGYELFANNAEAQQETAHLTMLFAEDGGYYIFLATYLKGSKQAKADIKKVMKTFRRK